VLQRGSRASEELRSQVSTLAISGAEKILGKEIDSKINAEQKVNTFVELASGSLNDQSVNLLKSLGENNRFALLPDMASLFETMKSESQGEVEGEIVAAAAMSEAQESAIVAALEKRMGRKVKLVTKIDEALLGGAVIRIGDLVIDGSLHGRFQKMKAAMS